MKSLCLILVFFLIGCSRDISNSSDKIHFNKDLWRSLQSLETDEFGITARQKMLDDLIEKHLIGKNKDEIISSLGDPSTKMDPDGEGRALSYPTGFERGSYMRIDSEWLLIYFDSSEIVKSYKIITD